MYSLMRQRYLLGVPENAYTLDLIYYQKNKYQRSKRIWLGAYGKYAEYIRM